MTSTLTYTPFLFYSLFLSFGMDGGNNLPVGFTHCQLLLTSKYVFTFRNCVPGLRLSLMASLLLWRWCLNRAATRVKHTQDGILIAAQVLVVKTQGAFVLLVAFRTDCDESVAKAQGVLVGVASQNLGGVRSGGRPTGGPAAVVNGVVLLIPSDGDEPVDNGMPLRKPAENKSLKRRWRVFQVQLRDAVSGDEHVWRLVSAEVLKRNSSSAGNRIGNAWLDAWLNMERACAGRWYCGAWPATGSFCVRFIIPAVTSLKVRGCRR